MRLKAQSGASAIIIVVVIGAAALVIARSASLVGLGELDRSYILARGGEVAAAADGCLEEILRRWQINPDFYLTTTEFTLGNNNCLVEAAESNGEWDVVITASQGEFNKKISAKVIVSDDGPTIADWAEIN